MIKSYTADYILPVSSNPIKDGVISVDESGSIIGIYEKDDPEAEKLTIEKLNGILVPGFVNSHCHLELSHLAKKFEKHLGLIPFIKQVIAGRNNDAKTIADAMAFADKQMEANGIVAVGDISNTGASRSIKERSSLFYHTFIELLCFEPARVNAVFDAGIELKEKFSPLAASIVPHASYSVCKDLLKKISRFGKESANLLSIHNQESDEENKFFRYKSGGFVEFYESMKMDISFFKSQARNAIQSMLPLFDDKQKIILVHNTYTSLKDLYFVRRFGPEVTWCFCPNANLYIEGKLPKIDTFLFENFNIVLGTDSLASNERLCILSELKTIAEHYPDIPLSRTIAWATLNGAKAFSIENRFGSLEVGKAPGLNLIGNTSGLNLTKASNVRKIA